MIIFLYGRDSYRLKQHARGLMERYSAKYPSGLNLFRIDGSLQEGTEHIADALKNTSFFGEVKLLAIKNAFQKTTAGDLLALLKGQDAKKRKEIVLMFTEELDEKELKAHSKELFAYLTSDATVSSFNVLSGAAFDQWIRDEAIRLGSSIGVPATAELVRRAGPDTWQLALELQKLANYRGDGAITLADVQLLVASPEDMNIFDLTDAVGRRNLPQAIALLYRQLAVGQDPYYILTMLTYHVRNLLALKDLAQQKLPASQGARKLGMHPYAARKGAEQAQHFSLQELKMLFSRLAGLEQRTKQGTVQLQDELYQLIVS